MNATLDHDKDSLVGLIEYAFGTDPLSPNTLEYPKLANIDSLDYFVYKKPKSDIRYTPMTLQNLGVWTNRSGDEVILSEGRHGILCTEAQDAEFVTIQVSRQ